MKTRQKRRRTLKKHCPCDCEATNKSPEIRNSNNKKSGRGSLKVNEKSIIIQKTTNKTNKKIGSITKQIKNGTSLMTALKKSPPIEKTNHNNGKILIKEPYVLLKRLNIKSPTMELRKNRQKNYCEPPSLHDESTNEKSTEKPMEKPPEKIPIYKQQIEDDTKKPKKKKNKKKKNEIYDLYEFDSDSEETKHKRHKKRKLNDSSHDEYNKTIENILKNVALKIKLRKQSPDKKTTDTNTNNNRNNNDEKVKKTRVNRRNVNEEEISEKTQTKDNKINNPESPGKKTTNSNTNNNDKDKRIRVNRRNLKEESVLKKTQIIEDKIDNQKSSTSSKPSPTSTQHAEKSSEINENSFTSSLSKLSFNDNDETFGFLDDNEEVSEIPTEEQTNQTSKINIISNVKLKPHQQLIFTRNPTQSPIIQPNANSTMIYNVLTPWRFNEINIRRNPHLIHVKKSALPCITQEPVLEYSIIEKLTNTSTPYHNGGDNDSKQNSIVQTPNLRRSPRKYGTPSIQKTLDDYYGDNNENKENRRAITRYSLFDADELSPIKPIEDKRSPLAQINSIKRQILSDFNENTKENSQISTINFNKMEDNHNNNEVKTYFGFETSKESNDNGNIDNDKVNKDDRPYRLSISTNDKKYEAKKKRARIEVYDNKEVNEDPPNKVINDDDDVEDNDDDDGKSDAESVGGGLFEEMHDDKEKKENMIKKRKVKWMLTDDDEKPRKRRKDVRTKKEEEAAERWAEQFNSMCKEVDEFPLEIE